MSVLATLRICRGVLAVPMLGLALGVVASERVGAECG